MEQDQKDRDREPDGARAAADKAVEAVPVEAVDVADAAEAGVPDSRIRARAGDRAREPAEAGEILVRAVGKVDEGADSAEQDLKQLHGG